MTTADPPTSTGSAERRIEHATDAIRSMSQDLADESRRGQTGLTTSANWRARRPFTPWRSHSCSAWSSPDGDGGLLQSGA